MPEAPVPPPPPEPSVLDDLLRRTGAYLREVADGCVKRPLEGLLRWLLGRAAAYLVAGGIFVAAAIFLMIAGVEGLRSLRVPTGWAYLGLGAAGLLTGWILLRAASPPRRP